MDEVEEIKRRIDIVEFISHYVTLKKAGVNYKAICPFHQEKTASLMVSPEKQIFHCFGCNFGGDVFTFVMKMENLEFREALEMLAEQAGVKLSRRNLKADQIQTDRKTRLYKINDLAARVFHKILISHPAGKSALKYLKDRKLTDQTIKDFQIGYAPSSRALKKFLLDKGFSEKEITEAGRPDRFFRRIIFPIRDTMGHVIAFTGRVTAADQQPKYLNTADTIIFHKGRLLYNLDQAKAAIKQEKVAVVVEGQMDVIASFQAGIQNVVATSGTALTDEHLQILYRYTPNITFAFDGDTAGLATAKKAYEMAIQEGFNVKMVDLGGFKDPGEMIANSPERWRKAVKTALPVVEWYFGLSFKNRKGEILTAQEKKEIAKELLPIIKIIPDSVEQAHYINLLAHKLGVKEEIIFAALSKAQGNKTNPQKKESTKKENLAPMTLLLAIVLREPGKLAQIKGKIRPEDFADSREKEIYNLLFSEYNKDNQITLKILLDRAERSLKNEISQIVLKADELYKAESEKEQEDFEELITHLKEHRRESLKSHYAEEIKKAENAHDVTKLKVLMKEFQDAIK
ncbi:MAG: DNA primase [Patescibacteria group bacterium]|jgi:DNA primase